MKKFLSKSKYICDFLLNHDMTLDFIKETATDIKPEILSEVIQCLKEHGKCPHNLNEILSSSPFPVFDIVGTGGTGSQRLNTSTLVSFFAGNFGINVIKHGGRSSSGKMGSVDFIESLGISLENIFHAASEYFRATGLLFLAAAYTYPIFAKSAPLRKQVSYPTLFNLLGPLLNPVPVQGKLIGAFHEGIAKTIAETCILINQSAVVVTSKDAEGYLDEASPFGKNYLYFCKNNEIFPLEIEPLETLSFSRLNLFTDSIKMTQKFLSMEKTIETDFIKKLIAFNLSILLCLNEFTTTSNEKLPNFIKNIPSKINKLYHIILSNFDSHIQKANEKIAQFVTFQNIHLKSPIHVKNNLISTTDKINVKNPSDVENFFSKEKLLIAEIKIARPQKNFHSSLSLERRIKSYQNADAISVVTHPSFSGSLDLLKKIRKLTNKPILAKDFIRKTQEVIALVEAGANGILLLQDMLTEKELCELIQSCISLNVASFVESSFVIPTSGDFHVLNSRSLFSLQENKNYRNFILNYPLNKIDKNKIIIASSLENPLQIKLTLSCHKGCIVGSALMEQENEININNFIIECKKNNQIIKFCGARTLDDIELTLSFQVDLVGINLIPSSKRFVGNKNLLNLLPYIEKIQDKICFITRFDACTECIKLVSYLSCFEQSYSAPLLPNRGGLLLSSHTKYVGSDAILLDGENPGSGITDKYPLNHQKELIPTFISGGIQPSNIFTRIEEAKQNGWNVIGFDCASAICHQDLTNQINSFSNEKMISLMSKIRG
jgi:anthranilate phosphoribosyltransferase